MMNLFCLVFLRTVATDSRTHDDIDNQHDEEKNSKGDAQGQHPFAVSALAIDRCKDISSFILLAILICLTIIIFHLIL
jgi:hypothetical protein